MKKVFQIYYKPELVQYLDPAFTPYDNTDNPRPELFEWHVWDKEYENFCNQGLDYWGFVSWKFGQKANISGQQFLDFVETNPGYDFYFVNPFIVNEAVHLNSWAQCDQYNRKTADIANEFLNKVGYQDIDVRLLVMDKTQTLFSNFFIANRSFWDKYIPFSRKILEIAAQDPIFKYRVVEEPFGYSGSDTAPHFTFLNERLVSTFLILENFKSLPYQYTINTVAERYRPYFMDIQAVSGLKMLTNAYGSADLYDLWNFYKNKLIQQHPEIMGLE